MFKQFEATIAGPRLMMHNVRLADPLDRYTKALKALTSNKKKSDEDHIEIGRMEFEGGLYFDPAIGPYVPDIWLTAMLVEGARKRKKGKTFEAHVSIPDEKHPLVYDGPRTVDGLWDAGSRFVDRRGVRVQQAKLMRTRPIFRDWKVTFRIQLLECDLNPSDIEAAILDAGPFGIGDGRPMYAGKFTLESFKGAKTSRKT